MKKDLHTLLTLAHAAVLRNATTIPEYGNVVTLLSEADGMVSEDVMGQTIVDVLAGATPSRPTIALVGLVLENLEVDDSIWNDDLHITFMKIIDAHGAQLLAGQLRSDDYEDALISFKSKYQADRLPSVVEHYMCVMDYVMDNNRVMADELEEAWELYSNFVTLYGIEV
jgi:hypothetical protein